MLRLEIAGAAIKDCFGSVRLWLLQFFANFVLFALFTAWLLIPVSSGLHLVFNFLLLLILAAAALMLHAGTLNYFVDRRRTGAAPLWPSFRRALQHLIAVAICAAILCLLWLLVGKLEAYHSNFPPYIRSMIPVFLRRHISLPALDNFFSCIVFVLQWILLPGLLLPLLLQTADKNFRGLGREGLAAWKRATLSYAYWLVLLAAALLGVFATQALMAWKPDFKTSTFSFEAFSLAVRLFFAYLFGLFSWILVCSSVSRHTAGTALDISGNPAA